MGAQRGERYGVEDLWEESRGHGGGGRSESAIGPEQAANGGGRSFWTRYVATPNTRSRLSIVGRGLKGQDTARC